jgi:hypothetical protein
MRINLLRFKPFRLLASLGIALSTSCAQATFINFDDIQYVPEDPESPNFYDVELTNQYADKGLLVDGGFIMSYEGIAPGTVASQPSYLLGSEFLTFSFLGDLPTFVGLYVSSSFEESIYFNAYNSSGLVAAKNTLGFQPDDDSENDDGYIPKQYVTFNSDIGISSITVENAFGLRASAIIDDLTFTRSVSVPEPSSVLLLMFGVLGLAVRRKLKN